MKWIPYLTHLAAALFGFFLGVFPLLRRTKILKLELENEMANKFESILKDVGKGILFVFTNKTAEAIEAGGLNIAGLVWPGLSPLFSRLSAAIAKAQAQAQVSTAGLTTEQIIALVLEDAQADFATAGIKESDRQVAIINAAIAFIDSIPSGSVNAAVVQSAVAASAAAAKVAPVAAAPVAAAPAPAAPAPAAAPSAAAAASVVQAGPGLDKVVPA
jgi:hypothetical protein